MSNLEVDGGPRRWAPSRKALRRGDRHLPAHKSSWGCCTCAAVR